MATSQLMGCRAPGRGGRDGGLDELDSGGHRPAVTIPMATSPSQRTPWASPRG